MLELVTLVLAVASLILHYLAPKTKTGLDDKALVLVEKATVLIPKADVKAAVKAADAK